MDQPDRLALPRLRHWRERRALTIRELADRAGVAFATVWRLEHQKTVPEMRTIRKLAAALGVEPHELMAPEGEAETAEQEAASA